ncbi:class II fructose-bisphosphatase [Siculibacillus lacustris]|uniref:Fructose-1,6-bisphosphatase n=1 Tax=Siculibacillus lacustris TaxID=1549641 RepID=A0A4Q9VE70_9HYPH|nr:class II fructose-bisphosphatase [Siculibacillus lacustris]TBW33064.1 class II fructose-bisphosphatase [Siculibacillus lacustris]
MTHGNTAAVRLEEPGLLDRILTLELVRVTERTAVAAARLRGRGDEIAADRVAVDAMHRELSRLPICGTVVIGEGERDANERLWLGETVGSAHGPKVDIAVVPLEGTTICAKNLPNSISLLAVAEAGSLLKTPDVYMEKIAIGPGFPEGLVDLDRSPAENLTALAAAKGVPVAEITACILDRPRHARLIEEVRATGAAIRLIGDGDVAGVIHTTEPTETGVDIYMGSGGAPEGILAAAALRCIGGQMQGRLMLDRPDKLARARELGIVDPRRVYRLEDMARGDVLFAATGVTDGSLLQGVKFGRNQIVTHTVVMRASTGTVRWIRARHMQVDKFGV